MKNDKYAPLLGLWVSNLYPSVLHVSVLSFNRHPLPFCSSYAK